MSFPKGEAFFVESVRAFRKGTPPKLDAEIGAFITQEVRHMREHTGLNKIVTAAGYDVSALDAEMDAMVAIAESRTPIVNLAATVALEHFTAIIAHELLANTDHLADADIATAQLWRWHGVEEIEHKGVAFDTWLHATRDWSGWKRWKVRCMVMLLISYRFIRGRKRGILDLLKQDGIHGPRAVGKLLWFAFCKPGLLTRILIPWAGYFRTNFHPWDHNDLDLVERGQSEIGQSSC
jgi:predicted metal-dependent hydrolase